MTIDDFIQAFEQERAIIECKSTGERNEILCFLRDLGYKLNSSCREYINEKSSSTEFMHPGLSNVSKDRVACFRDLSYVRNRPILCYADVAMINNTPSQIDTPDEAEFNDGISSLLFG